MDHGDVDLASFTDIFGGRVPPRTDVNSNEIGEVRNQEINAINGFPDFPIRYCQQLHMVESGIENMWENASVFLDRVRCNPTFGFGSDV